MIDYPRYRMALILVWFVAVPAEGRGEWRQHQIRQGNGQGGWGTRPALRQVLCPYVDYWIGRLEFGMGYFDAVLAFRRAAKAHKEGRKADAIQEARAALEHARAALDAYARVAQDQSDRGAIATMAEYVYRPLRAKIEELQK